MGLLSLSNLVSKRQNSLILKVKREFKGQIVWKFDLGLLNADNLMYFDINISEDKDGKKIEGSFLSCVTKGEFYFNIHIYVSKTGKY